MDKKGAWILIGAVVLAVVLYFVLPEEENGLPEKQKIRHEGDPSSFSVFYKASYSSAGGDRILDIVYEVRGGKITS